MKQNTYCNPMPLPDLPKGLDEALLGIRDSERDYCSISDPDGYFVDGVCYLFTSYGGAYSSEDMMHWKRHHLEGIKEIYYGPAVMHKDDKFYFTAGNVGMYVSDKPAGPYSFLGEFKLPSGEKVKLEDPDLFLDDDGKVYIFWGCGVQVGIVGARLDENDLTQIITEPKTIIRFNSDNEWERWGEYNQDKNVGWIEGCCMVKVGGRYFLNYAACGTTFSRYASGAYYSDTSPLEGFVYQQSNPYMTKISGILRGGGHNCVVKKNDDELWGFYTCPVAYSHRFERLIGMDRVTVKNGELSCVCSDIPCDLKGNQQKDMLPLTFLSLASASSAAEGRDAIYAFDDSMLSFWQPADDGINSLTISLRGRYNVKAYRIIRRELSLDFENGIVPRPLKYKIFLKTADGEWQLVRDCFENDVTKMVEYEQIEATAATEARLVIEGNSAIVSFTVFGEAIVG